MGVELQVKERLHAGGKRNEYVVTFYDPNLSATHSRLVVHDPRQLKGRSLRDWVGESSARSYAKRLPEYDWLRDQNTYLIPWPPLREALPPQHALVGKPVEVASEDAGLVQECWEMNFRAVPGGSQEHVLCVADKPGIEGLAKFRKSADDLFEAGVPHAAIEAAFKRAEAAYLVPASDLRQRTNPKRAKVSKL